MIQAFAVGYSTAVDAYPGKMGFLDSYMLKVPHTFAYSTRFYPLGFPER